MARSFELYGIFVKLQTSFITSIITDGGNGVR
jgi:hypothetical protein